MICFRILRLEILELSKRKVTRNSNKRSGVRGRKRKKDYSKLAFDYKDQLKQGVYLIYNDTTDERYVGKTKTRFSDRFSKRENEYQRFLKGVKLTCPPASKLLFGHDDSKMEWLFIPFEEMDDKSIRYIEDLCIKHFEYNSSIINEIKPKKTYFI